MTVIGSFGHLCGLSDSAERPLLLERQARTREEQLNHAIILHAHTAAANGTGVTFASVLADGTFGF